MTKTKNLRFILCMLVMVAPSMQTNCWSFYGLMRSYSSALYRRVKPLFIPAAMAALSIYGSIVAYKKIKIWHKEKLKRELFELREDIKEAIKVNDLCTLKEKIKKVKIDDELFYFALEKAWSLGRLNLFYFLISQNKNPEILDTYLNKAVKSNDYNVAAELLSMGANPNSVSLSDNPLKIAIRNDNSAMVKLLLQYKADPLHLNAFDVAFEHNATRALSELLKLPIHRDIHKSAEKIYRKSIEQNKPDIAKIFKAHPHFGSNYTFEDGDFPLMVAMSSHQPKQVGLFSECTQYSLRGKDGHTPLIRACTTGHSGIAAWLISQGERINDPIGTHNLRLIHYPIINGHLNFYKKLLYFGAYPHHLQPLQLQSILKKEIVEKERKEFLDLFIASNPRQKLIEDGFRLTNHDEQKWFNEMLPRVRAKRLNKLHDILHSYPKMHESSPHDKIKIIDAIKPSIGIINDYLALDDMRE